LAARFLKIGVKLRSSEREDYKAFISLLSNLKLTPVGVVDDGPSLQFFVPPPHPSINFILSKTKESDVVVDLSAAYHDEALDVHRPGEDLEAIRKGLAELSKSVELVVIPHATKEDVYDHLESAPCYNVFHFVGHGNLAGSILLEDENRLGWARHVGRMELAEMIQDRVSVFVNSACFGEESVSQLLEAKDGKRLPVMVFVQGEYPIPTRAIQLFSTKFYQSLAGGGSTTEAFEKAINKVKRDDFIGEVSCPDGALEDKGTSPFKRLKLNQSQAVSFSAVADGCLMIRNLSPPAPIHRRILRDSDWILGREVEIAKLIDELRPPKSGLNEDKHRLINVHGEGGIGKTRLAQAVCDKAVEYGCFPGGVFEIDCEKNQDTRHLALGMLEAIGSKEGETILDPVSTLPFLLKEMSHTRGDTLLLLDNLDPLFSLQSDSLDPHPATLIKGIFSECPKVRILSTCRTKLNLGGYETDFIVDPLADKIALELFVLFIPDEDVRQKVDTLPEEDRFLLKKLVNSLGGHPLSIFLAAHRIGTGLDPIEKQLIEGHRRLTDLLQVPDLKGLSEKQKSLQASLDLSYSLLFEIAQTVFRKSSFFPGGLYSQVATLDNLLGKNWRKSIQEATHLGLYRFERNEQRYWMLNPISEYAQRRLSDQEKDDFYREATKHWAEFVIFQDFMLNPAQSPEMMKTLPLPNDPKKVRKKLNEWHERAFVALRAEETNILHAFQWAIDYDFESGERIATGLMDYLKLSDKRQTNAWIALRTLEKCTDQETMSKWLSNLGSMLSELGDREGAREKTEEGLKIYRKLAKKHPEAFLPDVAMTLNNLGNRLSELGDSEGALRCFEGLIEVQKNYLRYTSNPAPLIHSYIRVASFLLNVGEQSSALACLDKAKEILDPIGEKHKAALKDLIGVNEARLTILRELKNTEAEKVAQEIETQKTLYDKDQ